MAKKKALTATDAILDLKARGGRVSPWHDVLGMNIQNVRRAVIESGEAYLEDDALVLAADSKRGEKGTMNNGSTNREDQ